MNKKIFIIVGHPDTQSLNRELMDNYALGARNAGHEVRMVALSDISFDPILHKGYREIQPLEPGLKQIQENIKWCEHLVIIYPSWWSTMPSLLKGMFDRIWLPGFAFHFHKHGLWWDGLLRGRSARVFVTSDSHPFFARLIFGDTTNEIRKGILWFAGIKAKIKKIGPMKNISVIKKEKWLRKMREWGRSGY